MKHDKTFWSRCSWRFGMVCMTAGTVNDNLFLTIVGVATVLIGTFVEGQL